MLAHHGVQIVSSALFIAVALWGAKPLWKKRVRRRPIVQMPISISEAAGLPLEASVVVEGKIVLSPRGEVVSPSGYHGAWWQRTVYNRIVEQSESNREFYIQSTDGQIPVFPEGIDFQLDPIVVDDGSPRIEEKILLDGETVRLLAQIGQTPDGSRFLHCANERQEATLVLLYRQ